MESIINVIVTLFNATMSVKVFNIPLLVWFAIPTIMGIIFSFIGGKKE